MARCDVLCTPKPLKQFKGAKDGAIKVQRIWNAKVTRPGPREQSRHVVAWTSPLPRKYWFDTPLSTVVR